MEPVVVVHGGAGVIRDPDLAVKLIAGVKAAAIAGYQALKKTGCVLDAAEVSVRYLEDSEHFNAGKGSVLNLDGEIEMDASIMLGDGLRGGAVTIVKDVKNPISLARLVMEKTPHTLIGGEGATRFAKEQGVEFAEPGSLVTKRRSEDLERIKKQPPTHELGTVGAVAMDALGRLAAATSTGGFEGKMVGRCSDTCVLGSGTYADDSRGAVSTTGHGESIMRFCLAYEILKRIEGGCKAQEATDTSLNDMLAKLKNTAGAITISKHGDVGVGFSSPRMSWAYVKKGEIHYGVHHGQHEVESIDI